MKERLYEPVIIQQILMLNQTVSVEIFAKDLKLTNGNISVKTLL